MLSFLFRAVLPTPKSLSVLGRRVLNISDYLCQLKATVSKGATTEGQVIVANGRKDKIKHSLNQRFKKPV